MSCYMWRHIPSLYSSKSPYSLKKSILFYSGTHWTPYSLDSLLIFQLFLSIAFQETCVFPVSCSPCHRFLAMILYTV